MPASRWRRSPSRSASASTRSAAARARSPWRRRCGRGSWSVWRGPSSVQGSPRVGSSRCGSTSRARAVHGALRELGDNAIEKALALVAEIQAHPGSAHEHPLLGRNIPMVWEIRGGQPLNVVPDACSVHLDWRVTPGGPSSAELFDWLVEAAAGVGGEVEVVEVVEPFETPADAVARPGARTERFGATTGTRPGSDRDDRVDRRAQLRGSRRVAGRGVRPGSPAERAPPRRVRVAHRRRDVRAYARRADRGHACAWAEAGA